jgi:ATP-dependent DNA ligase
MLALPVSATVDGEGVVCDERGVTDFDRLRTALAAKRRDRPYRSGRCADWVKVRNPEAPATTRIMEWE